MSLNSFEAPLKLDAGFCFSVSNVLPLVFLTTPLPKRESIVFLRYPAKLVMGTVKI